MCEEDSVFEKPSNENVIIWRYLDFTKFVSFLDKKALFFSRADQLGDPFEGSFPEFNVSMRQTVYKDIPPPVLDQLSKFNENLIRTVFVNSWHLSEFESAAMWKLYLTSGEGVAVKSTFKKLTDSFSKTTKKIYLGLVKYIDYETEWCPEGNTFFPFLHKRKSFSHEQELRAVYSKLPTKDGKLDWSVELPLGFYADIDLEVLVDEIRVFPLAPKWFHEVVESVAGKYGLAAKKISQSLLNKKPVY